MLKADWIAHKTEHEAVAVGLGEAVCAQVEPIEGAAPTETEVQAHVRARLARYKSPQKVVLDPALPREDSGKLFKRHIKATYWPSPSQTS